MDNEVITPGLVAELRDVIRDLLPYVNDPADPQSGLSGTSFSQPEPSQIRLAEMALDSLRKRAEVVARARRLAP